MMGPTRYPEESLIRYQSTLRNIRKEQRSALCLGVLQYIGYYVRQTPWLIFGFIYQDMYQGNIIVLMFFFRCENLDHNFHVPIHACAVQCNSRSFSACYLQFSGTVTEQAV